MTDVAEAFRRALPQMRARFHRKVLDLGRTLSHDYQRLYPIKVLQLAQEELRARVERAHADIEALLRDGWQSGSSMTPTEAFELLIGAGDGCRELVNDLNAAIAKSFVDVRRSDPEQESAYQDQLQRLQDHLIDSVHGRLYAYIARKG